MTDFQILQPVAVLALFTLAVLLLVPIRIIKAKLAQKITDRDLKYGVPVTAPADICIANRNYMNLLEAPVLFYVACLLLFVVSKTDAAYLTLAWAYVALRVIHSAIHLTYNRALHRGLVFAASNSVLVLIWIRIFLALWK